MNDNSMVSVCIPAYNNAEYIKETIDSVLESDYENIELIIVDDNSGDDTYDIIKEYESKDERVRAYHNDANLGMVGNWNKCLSLCTGDYIKLICADDLLLPETIGTEVEALNNNKSAMLVCSDTRLLDLNGHYKGMYKRYKTSGLMDGKALVRKGFFSQDYFGAPQAVTFRRSALEAVGGFDPYYTYILDYDFFVSIAMLGDIYIIHKTLNMFRVRNDSNTGQVMGGDKDKLKMYLDEHRHLFNKQRKALGLSESDINNCMRLRRLRCFMAYVYLKVFVRK